MRKAYLMAGPDPAWPEIMIEGPRPTYGDQFEFCGVRRTIIGFKPGKEPESYILEGRAMWRTTVRVQETGRPESMLLRDVEAYEADPRNSPLRHVTVWKDLLMVSVPVRESYLDDAP